ncbi:hypothetical protein HKCCE3408_10085 [Rhodobacterales bacterium HKCCE3408]|nr:hypothetical protein [Rhodobacterales bacterium HKCCE3408]
MTEDFPPDILIVAAVIIIAVSLSSAVAAWISRRSAIGALIGIALGIGTLVLVYVDDEDGMTWQDIPQAFVSVADRILN